MMKLPLHFAVAMAVIVVTVWVVNVRNSVRKSEKDVEGMKDWQYEVLPIDGGIGPESFAFDPHGEGPYTGISDGRIIKWQGCENRWLNFSFTSPHRNEECGGAYEEHGKKEEVCGRPLGLCFSMVSNELYIADAYNGLVVVGPNGGTPLRLISTLVDDDEEEEEGEGEPLTFTNGLDVDQRTGAVYFTTSSSKYQRRNYISLILSKDKSGKLMKYEPESEEVSIVVNNLSYANGVALSKDGDYILIVETTTCRVLRYWLQTPKAGTLEWSSYVCFEE